MSELEPLLEHSTVAQAAAALNALRSGGTLSDFRSCDVDELRRVYLVKAEHVRKLRGEHAEQLAHSTAELVASLDAVSDVRVADLKGPAPYSFIVFVGGDPVRLLGCLKVVSRLDVTPADWERLWQDDSRQ